MTRENMCLLAYICINMSGRINKKLIVVSAYGEGHWMAGQWKGKGDLLLHTFYILLKSVHQYIYVNRLPIQEFKQKQKNYKLTGKILCSLTRVTNQVSKDAFTISGSLQNVHSF